MKAISLKAGAGAEILAVVNKVANTFKAEALKIGIIAASVAFLGSIAGAEVVTGAAAMVAIIAVYSVDKMKGGAK